MGDEERVSRVENRGSGGAALERGVAAGQFGAAVGRDLHGNLVIQGAVEAARSRAEAPSPPGHFVGREKYLDRISKQLLAGKSIGITALQGMGGIGKTALAQKLAEYLKDDFPGGVLWCELGQEPDVVSALDAWARIASPTEDLSHLPDVARRADVVRSLLGKLGKLCVVLDDVWQVTPARQLLDSIPSGCPVLITTRDGDVAKALRCRVVRLGRLPKDEAIELLEELLGPLDDQLAAAEELAKLTDGLALALEIAAGPADDPSDLPEIVERLRAKPGIEALKLPAGEGREESVEACLALSYSALEPEMQRRFRALGAFAPASFDTEAVRTVWAEDDGDETDNALRRVLRLNLLRKGDEPGELRQHGLLRAYALALLEREGETNRVASRHAEHYKILAETRAWQEVEQAYEQIDHAWRWVRSHDRERLIVHTLASSTFLRLRGRHSELLERLTAGLKQATDTGDRKTEGSILHRIAFSYEALGEKEKALEHYQKALEIRRELGDRSGEGTTLNNIAAINDDLGGEGALEQLQEALEIVREVGDRLLEGAILNNIAASHTGLGENREALGQFQEALEVLKSAGDRSGEGATLNNIATIYKALGEKEKALGQFQEALEVLRSVGDRSQESVALFNIGLIFEELDMFAEAVDHLEQAVAIEEEIGHPDLDQDRRVLERLSKRLAEE